MNFSDAQKDMDHAYFAGSCGVLVSGLIWLIAGLVALMQSEQIAMLALFLGGMFIVPLSMLLCKLLKRPGKHSSANPLAALALEGTFILFAGLFISYCVAQVKVEWFFPIMLIVIGVRYLSFQTLYGYRIYWLLGGVLATAGMLCIVFNTAFEYGAFIGGGIEVLMALVIMRLARKY